MLLVSDSANILFNQQVLTLLDTEKQNLLVVHRDTIVQVGCASWLVWYLLVWYSVALWLNGWVKSDFNIAGFTKVKHFLTTRKKTVLVDYICTITFYLSSIVIIEVIVILYWN